MVAKDGQTWEAPPERWFSRMVSAWGIAKKKKKTQLTKEQHKAPWGWLSQAALRMFLFETHLMQSDRCIGAIWHPNGTKRLNLSAPERSCLLLPARRGLLFRMNVGGFLILLAPPKWAYNVLNAGAWKQWKWTP